MVMDGTTIQPNTTKVLAPVSVKPSIWGRIGLFLWHTFVLTFIIGLVVILLAAGIVGFVLEDTNEVLNFLGVIQKVAVALGIFILLAAASIATLVPRRFLVTEESVTATNAFNTKKYSFDEYDIAGENITVRYGALPILFSRKLVITPRQPTNGKEPRPKKVKARAFSQKNYNLLLNSVQRVNDVRTQTEREALGLNQTAPTGPVVRESNMPVGDFSLDSQATYAIVNKPEDFRVPVKKGIWVLLGLFMVFAVVLMFLDEESFFVGIFLVVLLGIAMISLAITGNRTKAPKHSILGVEITPMALTLHVDGKMQHFPWDKISKATATAPTLSSGGLYNNPNRQISFDTPAGRYTYYFGLKTNQNETLDKNYYWFMEYLRLHLGNRLELEFS